MYISSFLGTTPSSLYSAAGSLQNGHTKCPAAPLKTHKQKRSENGFDRHLTVQFKTVFTEEMTTTRKPKP